MKSSRKIRDRSRSSVPHSSGKNDSHISKSVHQASPTSVATGGNSHRSKKTTGNHLQTMKAINKLLVIAALCAVSCSPNVVYREYKSFKGLEWKASDKAVFEVDITDTLSFNNISLMVRHAESYPFKNLFLFVTSSYPDGHITRDTLEVVLASDKGVWHGSGMGDIYDFKLPVKKNVRFPKAGRYVFTFEHAMRVDPLPLVMDFGFEIEKEKRRE